MPTRSPQVWTANAITTLRTSWDQGMSTAAIGRQLNTSKNAVIGKAHRIGLSSRASPIRSAAPTIAAPPRLPIRKCEPTNPSATPPSGVPARPTGGRTPEALPQRPRNPPPVQPASVPIPMATSAVARVPEATPPQSSPATGDKPCCWPIGLPGKVGFRFCDDAALLRKPYCAAHAALAYVKPRLSDQAHSE